MLITIQYPIGDLRDFIPGGAGKIYRPTWPSAQPDVDFVRGFGGVKFRRKGGLNGWVGETVYCDADRCVRFPNGEPSLLGVTGRRPGNEPFPIPLAVAFRRLYSDGNALWKVELGVSIPWRMRPRVTAVDWKQLIEQLLQQTILVPGAPGGANKTTIERAGPHIASSIQRATTTHKHAKSSAQDRYLMAGRPVLFIETSYGGPQDFIGFIHRKATIPNSSFDISAGFIAGKHSLQLPLYFLTSSYLASRVGEAREFRIALLRMHAQHECIRTVLESVATEKLPIVPRSPTSDILQRYLLDALQKLKGTAKATEEFLEAEVVTQMRTVMYSLQQSRGQELINSIRTLGIRRQIFTQLTTYIENLTVNTTMDNYNISGGQIGAVGPNAQVTGNTFNQTNQSVSAEEMAKLRDELENLRVALQARAKTPEETIAVGKVAEAQVAAKASDSNKVVAALKAAGKFAFDAAKEIGTSVAATVLGRLLGIPG